METTKLWTELKATLAKASSAKPAAGQKAFDAWTPAVTGALGLVVQVANGSNLILDPDLDTYKRAKTGRVAAVAKMEAATTPVLDELLEVRVDKLSRARTKLAVVFGLALLAALHLFAGVSVRTAAGAASVDGAREAFAVVGRSVDDMAARVEGIAAAIAQIAERIGGVEHDMGEVNAVAEVTSAASEQVTATAQETSVSAQSMAGSANVLAETASELSQLAAAFTLR